MSAERGAFRLIDPVQTCCHRKPQRHRFHPALHALAVVHPAAQPYSVESSWLHEQEENQSLIAPAASNLDQSAPRRAAVREQNQLQSHLPQLRRATVRLRIPTRFSRPATVTSDGEPCSQRGGEPPAETDNGEER